MRRFSLFLATIFIFSVLITSCESVGQADDVAANFYEQVENKNYAGITELIDEEALKSHPAEVWTDLLKAKEGHWGDFISYKRTAFSTKTENGQTSTVLDFTVEHEKGTVYERIKFVKRNDKMKIYNYQFNPSAAELE
jgi:hypothetical protein